MQNSLRPFLALLLGLALLLAPGFALQAQPDSQDPELAEARRLLELPQDQLPAEVERLSADQAAELVSQIRFLGRPENPQIDRLYIVLRHLESLRATELAQRRLNNLLLVLGLTLVLFTAFLVYVMLDQRRSIRTLQSLLQTDARNRSGAAADDTPVYRGE